MTFLIVLAAFVLIMAVLSALSVADRLPDTRAEVTQHGDYRL